MKTLIRSSSTKSIDTNSERYSKISSDDPSILNSNGKSQRLKRTISDKIRRIGSAEHKPFKHRHKFRLWLNRKDSYAKSKSQDTDNYSITSSVSTKIDTELKGHLRGNISDYKESVVYKSLPKHHIRKWLNNDRNEGDVSSILEIRQSNITRRIIKAKHYISLAAEQTAHIASIRQTARLMAFTGAITAAAFARVRAAQKNPNASHGSIANDTMYSLQRVSNALDKSGAQKSDYIELNNIFKSHFQYKGAPGYFKRLKPLRVAELDPNSAAYKMYYKMKAIPNPPIGVDPLRFYLYRDTFKQKKNNGNQINLEPQCDKLSESSDIQSMKSVPTRVSTAKSIFWSFVGMEAESTKVIDTNPKDIQTSQNILQGIHSEPLEHENGNNSSSKSIFWSFVSGKS